MKNNQKKPSVITWLVSSYGLDTIGPVWAALFAFAELLVVGVWAIVLIGYVGSFVPEGRERYYALWLLAAGMSALVWSWSELRRLRDRQWDDEV